MLASTAHLSRNLDLAEECTQDAYAKALTAWPRSGVPDRPVAWLTTVARNRARDLIRRDAVLTRVMPLLVLDSPAESQPPVDVVHPIDDDRLRLIFTCCHPALARDSRVALTLRLLCGLSTAEVARAFLVQESTMAARITRAKKKITAARIPYRVPQPADLPERLDAVLEVVHLVFTTGYTAPIGDHLVRTDLTDAAVDLARMLHQLMPGNTEAGGLLALILLVDARRDTRTGPDGTLTLLADQDRSRWDRARIDEGLDLLSATLGQAPPARYAVQAAIAAVHAEAPTWQDTDWSEIIGLYDVLLELWPSPVVRLNRAVAVGMRDGPQAGLTAMSGLLDEPSLAAYGYLSSARADFLRRLGRWPEAAAAYEEALALNDNEVERAFLVDRLAQVRSAT